MFEATLGAWADSVVAHTPTMPEAPDAAMAVDGKTLRGSKKQGAPGTHLLSVLAHHVGLTLTQQAVAAKTNEIKAPCPGCGASIRTSDATLQLKCSSCHSVINVRDEKLFLAEKSNA